MDDRAGIDPGQIKFAVERILALKSEVVTLRERVEKEQLTLKQERASRESLEEEIRKLQALSENGNGNSKRVSQDVVKKLMATIPDKLAAILHRKGEAFLPGLGRFVLRYGPEGSVVDFEPDEGFMSKL